MWQISTGNAINLLFLMFCGLTAEASSLFDTWYRIQHERRVSSERIQRFNMTGLPMNRALKCLAQCDANPLCQVVSLDQDMSCILGLISPWTLIYKKGATTYHKWKAVGQRPNDRENMVASTPGAIIRTETHEKKAIYECPKGYEDMFASPKVNKRPSCYLYIKAFQNWTSSDKLCKQKKGYLTSIESEQEQNYVTRFIKQRQGLSWRIYYWLSGLFEPKTQKWHWNSTGELMGYTNWLIGQPSFERPKSYCMVTGSIISFSWMSWRCHFEFRTVCESKAVASKAP